MFCKIDPCDFKYQVSMLLSHLSGFVDLMPQPVEGLFLTPPGEVDSYILVLSDGDSFSAF